MGVRVAYLPKACIHNYVHGVSVFCCNEKNRRSGEINNSLFDTYNNTIIKNGKHTFQTASDMAKICAYPS